MEITTTEMLILLAVEKEENIYVTKELYARTLEWIELFKSYPDIEFHLDGDLNEYLIPLLDRNKPIISVTVRAYKAAKRQHGPAKKAVRDLKKNYVGLYFNDEDYAKLCNRAGTNIPVKKSGGDTASRKKLADYLRAAAFGALPPKIPKVNYKVWTELSPVISNLNQIAHKLNKGMVIDNLDVAVFAEINDKITAIRKQLIESEL